MSIIGAEIGGYLDPTLVDSPMGNDEIITPPSGGGEIHGGPVEVLLVDGRTAIIDSNGVIVGFR